MEPVLRFSLLGLILIQSVAALAVLLMAEMAVPKEGFWRISPSGKYYAPDQVVHTRDDDYILGDNVLFLVIAIRGLSSATTTVLGTPQPGSFLTWLLGIGILAAAGTIMYALILAWGDKVASKPHHNLLWAIAVIAVIAAVIV